MLGGCPKQRPRQGRFGVAMSCHPTKWLLVSRVSLAANMPVAKVLTDAAVELATGATTAATSNQQVGPPDNDV